MSPRRIPRAAAATVAVWFLASPAAGQTVTGSVVDDATDSPVVGAFVSLLDAGDARAVGVLTNDRGRYTIVAPRPGRYRLRIEHVGFTSVTTEPLELEEGRRQRRSFRMTAEPIAMAAIEVEAERQCRSSPADGAAIARVWDEARKALTVAHWTERESVLRYAVEQFTRELDPADLRVRREARRVETGVSASSPFRSPPLDVLVERGFAYPDTTGDAYIFNAPDAETLLSDAFVDTHCFRLIREGRRIGLRFEPGPGRDVADIRGTLWLDGETAELRRVEYHYTNLPWDLGSSGADLGGRVDFERLATGEWIVRSWRIRMPILTLRDQRFGPIRHRGHVVTRIRERGGEVVRVRGTGGRILAASERAAIVGSVWDSTRSAALSEAVVYLSGTGYEETTDAEGEFRITDVPAGSYTIGFLHPRLDSLGIVPGGRPVAVQGDTAVSVDLSIPSTATLLARDCPETAVEGGHGVPLDPAVNDLIAGTGVLHGRIRPRHVAASEVTVILQWTVYATRLERGAVEGNTREMRVQPSPSHRFRACGLPEGVTIRVRVEAPGWTSDTVDVRLGGGEIRRVDLVLERAR